MRKASSLLALAFVLTLCSVGSAAERVGQPAPDFTAVDSNGQTHSLSEYKGKYVVLEWHNNGCPFVRKHYESGNMQKLQKDWTSKGVVWLTVISSAPGQQGYVTGSEENAYMKQMGAAPTAALLDPKGTVGHLYGAKTSPHMFVVNPQGVLIYDGAIDDKPTTDKADVNGAKNYVNAALTSAMQGKPVDQTTTRPYGCSVKYAQ
jgi:alkyl hydroperoxide reductase subunit AhpC